MCVEVGVSGEELFKLAPTIPFYLQPLQSTSNEPTRVVLRYTWGHRLHFVMSISSCAKPNKFNFF